MIAKNCIIGYICKSYFSNVKTPTRGTHVGAVMLTAWLYVHGSLLSVAHYPKPLQR